MKCIKIVTQICQIIVDRVAYEFEIPFKGRNPDLHYSHSTPCGNYNIKIKIVYNIGVLLYYV
jgi:hypothetical protein